MINLEYNANMIDILNKPRRIKVYLYMVITGYTKLSDVTKGTGADYRTVRNVLNAVETGTYTNVKRNLK